MGGGVEKKMATIVLVTSRWGHHNMSNSHRMFSDTFTLSLTPFIEYYGGPEICVIVLEMSFRPLMKRAKRSDVETKWRHGF